MARERKQITKAEIDQAACDAFLTRGYSNTCHREIARELEMSTGNITYYYPSKEHLLAVLTERLCEFRAIQHQKRVEDGCSPLEAVCKELAYVLAVSEADEIAKDMYTAICTGGMCLNAIRPHDVKRAKEAFADYCDGCTDEQYDLLQTQVYGIMFTLIPPDEMLTVESRIRTLLRGVLMFYQVPDEVRDAVTDKILSADYMAESAAEFEAFKEYVTARNEQKLRELITVRRRHTMITKPEGLLDRLQFLTGCEYLSDLRSMDYERIREVLPKLNAKDYSLAQWLDAADYLTGTKPETDSIESVRDYLLHFSRQ